MKTELEKIFLKYSNDDKLPIICEYDWQFINEKYDKDDIKDSLIRHIKKYSPPYPVSRPKLNDVIKKFHELKYVSIEKYAYHISKISDVIEKFDYGEYSWDKCGLGVINVNHVISNDISNYFMKLKRLRCGSLGLDSPHETWENVDPNVIMTLLRGITKELSESDYIGAIRSASYVATQFKPAVAKIIYDLTNAETVLDTSSGWGDRLAGFYCSNAKRYVGCDPNYDLFETYVEMIKNYEYWSGNSDLNIKIDKNKIVWNGRKNGVIYHSGAEDLMWVNENFDVAFTSPPHFSTEEYAKGSKYENMQSWKKYDTYDKWRDNFLLPVTDAAFRSLKPNGYMIINILDPVIKNTRYNVANDLIGYMENQNYNDYSFCGNIGMRYSQRPESLKSFDDEVDFDKFMKKWYIEPMWTFRRNKEPYNIFHEYREKIRSLFDLMD